MPRLSRASSTASCSASTEVPGVDYTEPLSHRYTPTDRLVSALVEAMGSWGPMSAEQMAVAFLTWANERPDLDATVREAREMTDAEIVARVRRIVSGPLVREQEGIREQLEAAVAERDRLADRLLHIQNDLAGVGELIKEVVA